MPTPKDDKSRNAFESDIAGTEARTRAEGQIEDLRLKGGLFVEAVRATRMAMAVTDPTIAGNPIVFANQSFLKLSGYSMDEVLGQQPYFMNGPDTDPADVARFEEALRSDQDDLVETIQYRKDGTRFIASVLLSAFKDDDGNTVHHFLSWLDVTRRQNAENRLVLLQQAQDALRASEEKYRSLFESIDEGFCVIEVLFDSDQRPIDYVFLETNPVFERQTGIPDAVGRRMREIAPKHEEHWFQRYGRIALTGEPERFEDEAAALGRYYDVYAFRVGQPEERKVAIIFRDVLERRHAEIALRDSQAQLEAELRRSILLHDLSLRLVSEESLPAIYREILSTAVAITESDAGSVQVYDPATQSLVLLVTHGVTAEMEDYFHRVDAGSSTACGIALKSGQRTFVDFDSHPTDKACRMHVEAGLRSAQATPVLSRDGESIGMINTHWRESGHRPSVDQLRNLDLLARLTAGVVEQRQAEAALIKSNALLQTTVDSSMQIIQLFKAVRDEDDAIVDFEWLLTNKQWNDRWGSNAGKRLLAENPAVVESGVWDKFVQVMETGVPITHEHFYNHEQFDGWFLQTIAKANDGILLSTLDITDRKLAERAAGENERHAKTLLAELQHRVRNTLAVVRAIARRTAENTTSAEEMLAHFQGRIDAFSRVQAAVTRNAEGLVDLQQLVEDELVAHATREGERLRIDGPPLQVRPRAAEQLSLAIHELATNAVKHGALANSHGRISIAWKVEPAEAGDRLVLSWTETDVELPDSEDMREGFGMELLLRSLPYDVEGETEVKFAKDGLRFELRMPLGAMSGAK